MTTLLDTLLIKIDGDSRGIQSVIKGAVTTATGAVNEINKQEVDWTSIFSRAVTPAIISGVASVLAYAIDQTLQFQQAMGQTGAAVGDTASQIGQLSTGALNLSTQIPEGAQSIADAMAQVGTVFGQGSQATTDLVQQMGELAYVFGEPLSDVVSSSMDLFKQWGITTENSAISALTDLMHGAQNSGEGFSDFASNFASATAQLPAADKGFQALNGDISTFSGLIQTTSLSQANSIFSALVSSAGNAGGTLEQVGMGFQSIQAAFQSGNLANLIQQASDAISKIPSTGAIAIIGPAAYAAFTNVAAQMPTFMANVHATATDSESISTAFQTASTFLTTLQTDWNQVYKVAIEVGTQLESMAGELKPLVTDAESLYTSFSNLWDTITGASLGQTLTGALSDFNKMVQVVDILVDGFTTSVALVSEIGTLLKDAITGNWTQLSKDFGNFFDPNSPLMKSSSQTMNDIGTFFSQSGMMPGTTPQGAATGGLLFMGPEAASVLSGAFIAAGQAAGNPPTNSNPSGVIPGGNTNATFNNTFNIATAGSGTMTASQISKALYNQFQGL